MKMRKIKRIVVKVGTKVLTSRERLIDKSRVRDMALQISSVMNKGIEVILVTSGAIGAGMSMLGMKERPGELSGLQAAAATGQGYLMQIYSEYFKEHKRNIGQILLTQEDFNDRKRYLNIKNTINTLLSHNVVPIINENDTVATDEIRCGDNDRLSSLVADLADADMLILLSDVDGLLDEDGRVVPFVEEITPKIMRLGGRPECDLGVGGMATKIAAARTAAHSGIDCVIANGLTKNALDRILVGGEPLGTFFKSIKTKLLAKKRWIAFSSSPKGAITVDSGASEALIKGNKSLLASGITSLKGFFLRGDVVRLEDASGKEFGRGIANYSSLDAAKIKGLKTAEIEHVLGHKECDEVVHKDNLVIL